MDPPLGREVVLKVGSVLNTKLLFSHHQKAKQAKVDQGNNQASVVLRPLTMEGASSFEQNRPIKIQRESLMRKVKPLMD